MGIVLKSERELAKMREAGKIVCAVLDRIEAACVPGVTTAHLNRLAEKELARAKAVSAFLGYRMAGAPPYAAVLCTSVNDVVVHGIPNERETLEEGDVIGVDFACYKDGWWADAARTLAVGVISAPARALLDTTRASLEAAIAQCHAGRFLGDVGAAISAVAEAEGFSIVRDFVGHGIGRKMHEPPQVDNHGRPGYGTKLREGMVLAIEPMVNAGGPEVGMESDGWTVRTLDGSLSAHFEHSVAITAAGPFVITAA
jgi:methionyl aminopeptidase